VRSGVTTTCCGLVIAVGLQLPVPPPASPPAAQGGPALPAYDLAWRKPIETTGAIELIATERALIVTSPTSPLEARSLPDGKVLWTAAQPSPVAPARVGALLFVAEGQSLSAIALDTGTRTWTLPLDEPLTHVAAAGDWVIAVAESSVRGVQARDGRQVWLQRLERPVSVRPALDTRHVYFAPSSRWAGWRWHGELAAWDLATGNERWRVPMEVPADELTVGRDRLFVRTHPSGLFSVKADRGFVDWRLLPVIVIGRPAVDADHVYLALLDNTVLALDHRGARRWKTPLPGRPFTGPVLLGETVAVPLVSGEVAAIDRQSGLLPKRDPSNLEIRPFQAFGLSPDAEWVFLVTTEFGSARNLSALRRRR
jgi:outer membrane protein assembly factor BamB